MDRFARDNNCAWNPSVAPLYFKMATHVPDIEIEQLALGKLTTADSLRVQRHLYKCLRMPVCGAGKSPRFPQTQLAMNEFTKSLGIRLIFQIARNLPELSLGRAWR